MPSAAVPGNGPITLTVNGTGFVSGAAVTWDGSPLVTVFVNGRQLTATVSASDLSTAGTAMVAVSNPGGVASNGVPFSITNPTGSASFGGPEYPAGNVPSAVVLADYNRDGNVDIAVVNADSDASNTVSVLLGDSSGIFAAAVTYPTGFGPYAMASGDFNNDGNIDLAVANIGDNTVSVLLGNGDGTFASQRSFAAGGNFPGSIVEGDFDQDGKLDIAVANAQDGTVSVLLGNGDGTLRSAQTYSVGGAAGLLVVGDFNRDGISDLAALGGAELGISVLLGKGDGTFPTHTDYSGPFFETAIIAADLNGDGKPDLIVSSRPTGTTGLASVFFGNGDGTFQKYISYPTGGSPASAVAADMNGDGKIDIATASSNDLTSPGGIVSILPGNGDGTFQAHYDVATPESSLVSLAAADLNRDGRLDIVAISGKVDTLLQSPITVSQSFVAFANQKVGTTSLAQDVTLTNVSGTSVGLTGFTFTGANPTDFSQTNACGSSLAAGQTCVVRITFAPTDYDTRFALLNVSVEAAGSPLLISLNGFADAPVVTLLPTSWTFPTQTVQRTSPTQKVTLTNTGSLPLHISNMTVSGDFLMRNLCPSTVPIGSSCTISIAFKPTAKGYGMGR